MNRVLSKRTCLIATLLMTAVSLRAAEPEVGVFKTPGGVEYGLWGKTTEEPASILFILAGTIKDTLGSAYFRQCGNELSEKGYLLVSIDIPCHGTQTAQGKPSGLGGWAERAGRGDDFVAESNARLTDVLDHLIAAGAADPRRIAICGTSRGGFLAMHFAAHDGRVRCAAAFAPVTNLAALSEFKGKEELPMVKQLDLENQAGKLAERNVWIVIGDQDERVGTLQAVNLAAAIKSAAQERNLNDRVELHVMPEPRGHTTPKGAPEMAAQWILERIKDPADLPVAVWPAFPVKNAEVEIPAQEWPQKPGARQVKTGIFFPGGDRKNVTVETGLILTLHNWGGTGSSGTANPGVLADRLNVVAITVDYLQSGKKASIEDPEPYDFGYLQGLDALRALWFVREGLQKSGLPFANGRIFATGGSGGGNVALMVNKLAPRTFACVVDMCGMTELTDDMAFNEPGGTGLNARWSRDPESPNFLSPAQREIRHLGNPAHLALMKKWGNTTRISVIHGVDDTSCPVDDARRMVVNMEAAQLDVVPFFIDASKIDGKIITNTGHGFGDRTGTLFQIAGEWLEPGGATAVVRKGPTDLERRDTVVCYPVTGGSFTISYENGYPIGIWTIH